MIGLEASLEEGLTATPGPMAYSFYFIFLVLLHLHMLLQLMDLLSHNAPRGMRLSGES
jgi:hypothetical protein